jgi:5-methylcytosine-specific restriction endonuclease McrA
VTRRFPRGWARLSRLVIVRDGGVCWLCGELGADTADHVVSKKRGGEDALNNLRAAHRRCNSAKGTKSVLPFARVDPRWTEGGGFSGDKAPANPLPVEKNRNGA